MTIEIKKQLVDFENLANGAQMLKRILEELTMQLEEKVVTPLIKECQSDNIKSAEFMAKTTKVMRFVTKISNVIYTLTRITILLEKQWIPESLSEVPSEEYLLEYIRHMHKCGKLDFTV
jgi:hypothetical protein